MALKKIQLRIPEELKREIVESGHKYGMNMTAMCLLCLRAGLDVIKVAMSADYIKVMELLAKEYEQKQH